MADIVAAEAGQECCLVDRGMALRRAIDDERLRFRLQPAAIGAVAGRAFARARASAMRVQLDAVSWMTPLPAIAQAQHAAHPIGRHLFEFGQGRARIARRGPARRARSRDSRPARWRAGCSTENRQRSADAANALRPGMISFSTSPSRSSTISPCLRWVGRNLALDAARLGLGRDRQARRPGPVIRDPVDQSMTAACGIPRASSWLSASRPSRRTSDLPPFQTTPIWR